MADRGIFLHDNMLGVTAQVQGITTFIATLPDGTLHIQQLPTDVIPKQVGRTWAEVLIPPPRETFTLRQWRQFVEATVGYVYDDLMDQFSDDLTVFDQYSEVENEALPWNPAIQAAAQRIVIRYVLESAWAKSREGQEKGIAFCRSVGHQHVVTSHRLLYQTPDITDHSKHRTARFLAASVNEIIQTLKAYRRRQNATVRNASRAERRSPLQSED
ncbi:hypothetical protein Rctr85_073 [Virus Rctr85]|nr:hypothetical protein Rctr85_073 [Virus Rctr85]